METRTGRIVVIGATSSIALACVKLWIDQGYRDFALVGRSIDRLDRMAGDLRVRCPELMIETIESHFDDPAVIQNTAQRAAAKPIEIALVAHGMLPDQECCQRNLDLCRETLVVNGVSVVLFAEALANEIGKAGEGTLAVIGSVAGDRGRKSNYVYGSAKAMVEKYVEGLQHRFYRSGVRVVLIKPGPTETPMTQHLVEKGLKAASPDQVADVMVKKIGQAVPVFYVPLKWSFIMRFIRWIPRFIFNRLDI